MSLLRQIPPTARVEIDAEGLRQVVEAQHGVVSRAQLAHAGLSGGAISRWLNRGRLHRIHPHVYAVGHTALPLEGRLWGALLFAGAHAVLSHTTAAWIWSVIDDAPRRIHLTSSGPHSSLPDVRMHRSRQLDAAEHRGFPVTGVARTLLDLGRVLTAHQLRRALAEADFHGLLDAGEVEAVLRRGRPGSSSLRAALKKHMPQLAMTLSLLEQRFLEVCESAGLPLPEVNSRIGRMRVDAIWRDQMLAVELDGAAAHSGPAAMMRDRRRELALRAEGFRVVRYSWTR